MKDDPNWTSTELSSVTGISHWPFGITELQEDEFRSDVMELSNINKVSLVQVFFCSNTGGGGGGFPEFWGEQCKTYPAG
jgi:hypothetical protein